MWTPQQQLRTQGLSKMRYPYKDKTFYPLLWPAQAMGLEDKRLVLPMDRGRASLVLPRPDWLTEKAACRIVWNGVHNELHVTLSEPDTLPMNPASLEATSRHATVDLGQIHQAAVATNIGEALVVSGRGIRSLKRQHSKQLGTLQKKAPVAPKARGAGGNWAVRAQN